MGSPRWAASGTVGLGLGFDRSGTSAIDAPRSGQGTEKRGKVSVIESSACKSLPLSGTLVLTECSFGMPPAWVLTVQGKPASALEDRASGLCAGTDDALSTAGTDSGGESSGRCGSPKSVAHAEVARSWPVSLCTNAIAGSRGVAV